MFTPLEILSSALGKFFNYNHYEEGILQLRNALLEDKYYRDSWERVVLMIINKELPKGKALELIHNVANLPLDKNCDDEAYKWLLLMLINSMGDLNQLIIKY